MESLSKETGVNLHEEHLMLCLEKSDSLSANIKDEFILVLKKYCHFYYFERVRRKGISILNEKRPISLIMTMHK